ncbi:ester hydrolase C11orf54 homolog [Hydra vulgaris]|uniref:Ester hydrolase C11orf54 homolog n=1 Tax=Hydra vulgaris TaxID=6087 RepID=A0ABM4C4H7_HYDVU
MNYSIEEKELFQPPLKEICDVFLGGLLENFKNASVSIEECPDLTKEPWTLASNGICGTPYLLDVGGVPYLTPNPQFHKIYNYETIAKVLPFDNVLLLGSGAGPFHKLGYNCELMANMYISKDFKNESRIASIDKNGSYELQINQEKEFGILGNFLASEGVPGKVIKVNASVRKGGKNFIECIRESLKAKYPDNMVGIGGVFIIKSGKAKIHVMPDFSCSPLNTKEDVDNWLRFFEMSSPLICLSVFYNIDQGMDLRIDHTHCFSHHGDGGHYHFDTTPDDVSYEGFFVLAEKVLRIDRPC